jgi:ferredoxin
MDLLEGKPHTPKKLQMVDINRVKLEYFDPRLMAFDSLEQCASNCSSCGNCRDCGICITACPNGAISKNDGQGEFELVVNPDKCIGCGFCAGACPCGIWNLVENEPMDG